MKKLTLFFCFVFIFSAQLINAQTPRLWGITYGADYSGDSGTIYQANGSGVSCDSLYSFKQSTGSLQYYSPAGLTLASNGKLYGTTDQGGANGEGSVVNGDFKGYGVLYSFDPTTNTYTDMHDFDSIHGCNPVGNLVAATNGKLYGMTEYGGAVDTINNAIYGNYGVIFSFDPTTNTYIDVYDFMNAPVSTPWVYFGGLMQASNGLLYGIALGGDIFSFDPNTNILTNLYTPNVLNFPYNPDPPAINLTQAKDGKLYGIGWENSVPFIFSFDLNVDTVAPLYYLDSLIARDGSLGDLTLGNDGKLYGVSESGGIGDTGVFSGNGFIYSFNPSDTTFTELYDFDYSIGALPIGSLLLGSDGKFYGTTSFDTTTGSGYIFSFDPSNSTAKALHEFDSYENLPIGDLVELDFPYDVWPGDANNDLVVNNYDLLPIGLYYGNTGTARNTTNNTWAAQACTDWDSLQSNGRNRKFVDCNGDGVINADDTMAVSLNYGLTHHYNSPRSSTRSTQGVVSLSIVPDSTSYHAGSRVHAQVLLGTSVSPASNIYGLAYTIIFNTSIIQPGTLSFNYNNSFIGTKNTNALVLTHLNNDIESAVVGTDHINKNGYGKIGDLYFTLSTNPPTSQLVLSVSSYQSIDASGNPIVLLPVNDTLVIDGTTGFNQLLAGNNQLSIYPNPSSGIITISSTKNIDELKITNVLGQLIYEAQPKQTQFNFELKSEGMYFVTVTSDNETATRKLVVNR